VQAVSITKMLGAKMRGEPNFYLVNLSHLLIIIYLIKTVQKNSAKWKKAMILLFFFNLDHSKLFIINKQKTTQIINYLV